MFRNANHDSVIPLLLEHLGLSGRLMSMLITYIFVLRENLSSSVPFGKTYLSSTAIHGFIYNSYWDFLSRKLEVSLLGRKDNTRKMNAYLGKDYQEL